VNFQTSSSRGPSLNPVVFSTASFVDMTRNLRSREQKQELSLIPGPYNSLYGDADSYC